MGDVGEWQDGTGGEDTGGSLGLVMGKAGYIRLRKESLVCLFTCHRTIKHNSKSFIAADLTSVILLEMLARYKVHTDVASTIRFAVERNK